MNYYLTPIRSYPFSFSEPIKTMSIQERRSRVLKFLSKSRQEALIYQSRDKWLQHDIRFVNVSRLSGDNVKKSVKLWNWRHQLRMDVYENNPSKSVKDKIRKNSK